MTDLRLLSGDRDARVGLWSNYAHVTHGNQYKSLYYMASLGVQALAVKSGDRSHSYWRPRASLSASLRLSKRQSLRGSYYLTNQLPQSRYLVSFNQSTNPWIREEGNPYLVPMQIHRFGLDYNVYLGSFRLWARAGHKRHSQMIESYMRQGEGYQIKSYRNNGTYSSSSVEAGADYSGKDFVVRASGGYYSEVFDGQDAKGSYGLNGYVRWFFGQFLVQSSLSWRNRSYTSIGETAYKNPTGAAIDFGWQANKRLYMAVGLPYFFGKKKSVTEVAQTGYISRSEVVSDRSGLYPWFLVAWTLRKNPKLAIRSKSPDTF